MAFPSGFLQNIAAFAVAETAGTPSLSNGASGPMSRLVTRVVVISATAALLAACSSMPEWTKPSTWYDGVTGANKPAEKADAEAAKPEEPKAATEVANQNPNALPPVDDPLAPTPAGPRIKPTDKPTEFPNVAEQPAPREPTSTEAQKREIRDSLVADRDRAQYSADELRGGAQPAAAPPPPAAPKPAPAVEEKKPESE